LTVRTPRRDREETFLRGGRVSPRRRRAPRIGRLIAGGGLLLAVLAGVARFLAGSLFDLVRIEVEGNRRARTAEVLQRIQPWRESNLVTLDLAPLARAIGSHPWIERVTLSKRFPDGLSIRLVEKRGVALLREGQRLFWLAEDGRLIAPYDPRRDGGSYVLIRGSRDALREAVGLLEDLRIARPEYFPALSEIAALPDGGFGMMDSIFRRPVRVLREDASEKIRALLAARRFIESRGWEARAIDLRFADRIVLVGAYGAGSSL
jgi:cell division septal protein FtsQ